MSIEEYLLDSGLIHLPEKRIVNRLRKVHMQDHIILKLINENKVEETKKGKIRIKLS